MATPNGDADTTWGMLADEEEEERRSRMTQRYTELAALTEEERRSRMMRMAVAEYALSDAKLRTFTLSRLSVWISLDNEIAKTVAGSYDAVMLKMPGTQAMRRVALVQTLARDFSPEAQAQLVDLVPNVFTGTKVVSSVLPVSRETPGAPSAPAAPAKKGWWAFWKR